MGTGTRIYLSEIEQNRSENEWRIREIVRKMEVETEFERNPRLPLNILQFSF